MNNEILFGKNILRPNELQKVPIERIYKGIKYPKQSFADQIQQLRTFAILDPKQYSELKKKLPYILCGIFKPLIRKTENFAAIRHFIVDLDHLTQNDFNKDQLLQKLAQDQRVLLAFSSPGNDGIKLMFHLKQQCTDAALYSAFYKVFLAKFAQQYQLHTVLDKSTSDVTRVCFMSTDPNAHYNPQATPIALDQYIDPNNFDQSEKIIKQAEKQLPQLTKKKTQQQNDLDPEAYTKIKNALNPKFTNKTIKEVYVPPQLNKAINIISEKLAKYQLHIQEQRNIQYGKQLKIAHQLVWCEINIFFGKKGFRVVKTTKAGSNSDLADLAKQAIEEILFSFEKK